PADPYSPVIRSCVRVATARSPSALGGFTVFAISASGELSARTNPMPTPPTICWIRRIHRMSYLRGRVAVAAAPYGRGGLDHVSARWISVQRNVYPFIAGQHLV